MKEMNINVKIEFTFPFKETFAVPWNYIQMMIQEKLNEIRGLICSETHVNGIKMKLNVDTSDNASNDEIIRYYDDLDNVYGFERAKEMRDKYDRKHNEENIEKMHGFDTMFKPDIHLVIDNADKLDMTPEEYEKIKQRNAISLLKLKQRDPNIMNKHTDM